MDELSYYNNNRSNYSANALEQELALGTYVSRIMRRVYLKMALGLIFTALAGWVVANSPALQDLFLGSKVMFFGLIIAEVVVVIAMSAAINKISTPVANLLFFLYSLLNGITMAAIVILFYPADIVVKTFLITSGVFLAMTIFGYTTKQDLSKMGSILVMALIGLIICSLVNIFLKSSTMDWIISIAGVAIFVGLTAWDTQKIKNQAAMTDDQNVGKLATMGALSLYLDFINLFLFLLRIFASARD